MLVSQFMARTYIARIDGEPDVGLNFPTTARLVVNRQELGPECGFERHGLISTSDYAKRS
jgi:hypothetical protein